MTSPQTVHIVSNDADFRRWTESVVSAAGIATAVYDSPDAMLADSGSGQPACVIVENEMAGMTGMELLRLLHARSPSISVILVSSLVTAGTAVDAIRGGAHDVLEKPVPPQDLLTAVQDALARSAKRWMIDSARQRINHRIEALSARERQVMNLLAVGKHTKAIASDLGVSPKTVEHHRPKILSKMGVDNVVELSQMVTLARGISLETAIQSLNDGASASV